MQDINWNEVPKRTAKPDFNNLLSVLRRETPSRPTLFEFIINKPIHDQLSPELVTDVNDPFIAYRKAINAFYTLGYDYAVVGIPNFSFRDLVTAHRRKEKSVSLDEGSILHTKEDVDEFQWPDPDRADYGILDRLAEYVPDGMKLIVSGPCGLLENVTHLVGLAGICYMIKDDRSLAETIFEHIGSRLVRYYELAAKHPSVGAIISNDDWGFKSNTFFRHDEMRHFIFSWHRKMVQVAHQAGKPAILHSCGHFQSIIDDIVNDMKYDGRHSYEDNILPVEDAYEQYHDRIAILGGIDVDFMCRSKPEEVYKRSKTMLDLSSTKGSYALGTGNSVPEYLPKENYFALVRAALDQW